MKVSGLTGLKELDLSGFDRETLAGLDAATLTSLEKVDISGNKLDLAPGTENRQIFDTMLSTISNHVGSNEQTVKFDKQNQLGITQIPMGKLVCAYQWQRETLICKASFCLGL